MRESEVQKALRRLPDLNQREREIIQALAKRLVNKLLHDPTICLKEQASCSNGYRYAEVTRDLFGLDGKEGKK
jgi:glutamyl-tRNA reductase